MTQPFPRHPYLTGYSAPSGIECDAPDLIIEGELPADLAGVYFRNGYIRRGRARNITGFMATA